MITERIVEYNLKRTNYRTSLLLRRESKPLTGYGPWHFRVYSREAI